MSETLVRGLDGISVPAPHTRPASSTQMESDVLHSLRNAAKLGASLLVTWAVALGVRLVLPRYLGPELFGAFQFADAFATTLLVVTNLGIETYVRKEVATRREHASEFLGGVLVLRLALSAVLIVAALVALAAAGKPEVAQRLVLLLAITHIFVIANGTYGALLHAIGVVGALSVLNVASKLVWGAGIVVALAMRGSIESVAVALLASEVLKTACLALIARRHLALRLTVRVRATAAVLVASVPFYLASLSQTIYSRIDITFISFIAGDVEAGWYGASSNLAGMAMLLAPLIWWVLLPLSARAGARSDDELNTLTRRALELVLTIAVPITLFIALGADAIVRLVFGAEFAPSATSLRLLAPLFVLTYTNMVCSSVLVRLDRGWVVTLSLVSGLAISAFLNWLLIPRALAAFGDGGAGIGAAVALVTTEAYVTAVVTWHVGRRAFDARSITVLARTASVCAVVAAAHVALAGLGAARLLIDAALYLALAVLWKAIDVPVIVDFVRRALARREAHAGPI